MKVNIESRLSASQSAFWIHYRKLAVPPWKQTEIPLIKVNDELSDKALSCSLQRLVWRTRRTHNICSASSPTLLQRNYNSIPPSLLYETAIMVLFISNRSPEKQSQIQHKFNMPFSYAAVVAAAVPSPTPRDIWQALVERYSRQPLQATLVEALGLLTTSPDHQHPAFPLLEHCIVVTIDTEAWTANTDEMTEVGIVVADFKSGKELNGNFGDYAENVLKKMEYHHLRIWEHAHLKSRTNTIKGTTGNRFGQSKFVTFVEGREILDSILNQPIKSQDPRLFGLKRPVVLVGHAVAHDESNLKKQGFQYDFSQHGTVVKHVDTQKLTKEVKAWFDPKNPANDIGLATLCQDVFAFEHTDAHTALNDASRTIICAVNLALKTWTQKGKLHKTMQQVAWDLERHSQATFVSKWGSAECCTRCGGRDHSNDYDECTVPVTCEACERFENTSLKYDSSEGSNMMAESHIEQFCLCVAHFVAWKRRVLDAHRKKRRFPPGPPADSHPPSNWTGIWPMNGPLDLLASVSHSSPRPSLSTQGSSSSSAIREQSVRVVSVQSQGRAHAEGSGRGRAREHGGRFNQNPWEDAEW